MFHSFPKRGLNSYKRGRYIRGQAPLAIHTNHSLIALIICPHAHTCACACACVDIRNYSHKQLDLYTFTHTHQPCTLSPSLHSSLRTSHTITCHRLIMSTSVIRIGVRDVQGVMCVVCKVMCNVQCAMCNVYGVSV